MSSGFKCRVINKYISSDTGRRGRTWSASARSNASGSAFMMSLQLRADQGLNSPAARSARRRRRRPARAPLKSCSNAPTHSTACATVEGVPRLGANRRNAPRAGLSSVPRAPNPGASLREESLPRDAPASAGCRRTRPRGRQSRGPEPAPSAGCAFPEAAGLGVASDARDGCATRAGGFAGSTWVDETSTRTQASSRAWWSRARVSTGRVGGSMSLLLRPAEPNWQIIILHGR